MRCVNNLARGCQRRLHLPKNLTLDPCDGASLCPSSSNELITTIRLARVYFSHGPQGGRRSDFEAKEYEMAVYSRAFIGGVFSLITGNRARLLGSYVVLIAA